MLNGPWGTHHRDIPDLDGALWDVRGFRPTANGFDICMGWPLGMHCPGCGGPRVIVTRDLYAYWIRGGQFAMERSMIYPLAHHLDYYAEAHEWWLGRIGDLAQLTGVAFARTHGVSEEAVSVAHKSLLGKRLR